MPFVSRSGNEDDEAESSVAAGAPPGFDVDFDPNDPDQVKVHYDVSAWTLDQRAELSESLAEQGIPHIWEGDEVVVPEELEEHVDALFEGLEHELGPFPVPLPPDATDAAEIDLAEWPPADLATLREALIDAEVPHRWLDRTLLVARDAEHAVDDLVAAIEAGELASPDAGGEAPDGALHDLYVNADRLARDAGDAVARKALADLVPELSPPAPPYGIAVRAWSGIVERAGALVAALDGDGDGDGDAAVTAAADELRAACRPYV